MFRSRIRGGSLIEFALIAPLVAALAAGFGGLGALLLRQIQLERLSAEMARDVAASGFSDADASARAWLARRGLTGIEAGVELRALPSLPVSANRRKTPVTVVSLTLTRPGRVALRAHAREVAL